MEEVVLPPAAGAMTARKNAPAPMPARAAAPATPSRAAAAAATPINSSAPSAQHDVPAAAPIAEHQQQWKLFEKLSDLLEQQQIVLIERDAHAEARVERLEATLAQQREELAALTLKLATPARLPMGGRVI
jgi:hypothetical protein